jgi:hypothetical protein
MSIAPAPPISNIHERPVQAAPAQVSRELLTVGKLRAWGAKSVHSLADQGLTSLTSFCVSFLLARWMPPEVYGAYAIAFAGYLFVCGFHNVIVLEPMSVIGPSRHAAVLSGYFRAQIVVHAVLVGILSAVVALAGVIVWRIAPHSPLAGAILGSALALPFLLSLWLARRMCYVVHRPLTAMLGSGSCLSFVLLGLYTLRHFGQLSPFSAFLLIGSGSLAGSYLVLRQVGKSVPRAVPGARLAWLSTLKENWSYGRWLVGSTIFYSISGQVQMFLAAAFLGLGGAGILRAMLLPSSVMTQVVTAAGLLVLPGFSSDFGRGAIERIRQKAVVVSCVLGGSGLVFVALLALVATRAEHFLFSAKYAGYAWLMPILALIPAANGFTMGYSTALRASQRPHFDLLANAIAAPIAVVSALCFIHWWGLAGAAASMVAGFAVYMALNCWIFYATPHPVVAGLKTRRPETTTGPQP